MTTRVMATTAGDAQTRAGATMKALVQEGYGSADVLHLREIERPPLLEGRVLLRVRAASVNALDWHSVHGGRLMRFIGSRSGQKPQPVRGVDVSGYVEEVSGDVTQFKPGDEVFGTTVGAFAEYARAREDKLVLKPARLSFEAAAAVPVAGFTALQGLRDIADAHPGQRVLIHGAGGGVGTFAVQIAKALGLHVTAVTGPRNVDLVRSLGPDEVVDHSQGDFTRRAERYDIVFDIAATKSLSGLRRLLRKDGVLVLVGADKRGGVSIFARIIAATFRARVLRQRVKFFVSKTDQADLVALTELIEAGKLRPAIDRTYPLDQGAEAVRYVGSGQARAKVVITM